MLPSPTDLVLNAGRTYHIPTLWIFHTIRYNIYPSLKLHYHTSRNVCCDLFYKRIIHTHRIYILNFQYLSSEHEGKQKKHNIAAALTQENIKNNRKRSSNVEMYAIFKSVGFDEMLQKKKTRKVTILDPGAHFSKHFPLAISQKVRKWTFISKLAHCHLGWIFSRYLINEKRRSFLTTREMKQPENSEIIFNAY